MGSVFFSFSVVVHLVVFICVVFVNAGASTASASPSSSAILCNFTDTRASSPSTIVYSLSNWGWRNNSAMSSLAQGIADTAFSGVLVQAVIKRVNVTGAPREDNGTAAAESSITATTASSSMMPATKLRRDVDAFCGVTAAMVTLGNNFPPSGVKDADDERWRWAFLEQFGGKRGSAAGRYQQEGGNVVSPPRTPVDNMTWIAALGQEDFGVPRSIPLLFKNGTANPVASAALDPSRADAQIDFSLRQQKKRAALVSSATSPITDNTASAAAAAAAPSWILPSASHVRDVVLAGTRETAVLRIVVIDSVRMRRDCEFGSTAAPRGTSSIAEQRIQKFCDGHRQRLAAHLKDATLNETVAVTFVVGNDNVAAPSLLGKSAVFDPFFDAWLVPALRSARISAYIMAGSGTAAIALEQNVTEPYAAGELAYILNGAASVAEFAPSTNSAGGSASPSSPAEPGASTTAASSSSSSAEATSSSSTTTTTTTSTSTTATSITTAIIPSGVTEPPASTTSTTTAAPTITVPCTYIGANAFTAAVLKNGTCVRSQIVDDLERFFLAEQEQEEKENGGNNDTTPSNKGSSTRKQSGSAARQLAEDSTDQFLVFAHIIHLDVKRNPASITHCALNRSGIALFCTPRLGIRNKRIIVQIIPYDRIALLWACFAFVILLTALVGYFIRGKARIREAEVRAAANLQAEQAKEESKRKMLQRNDEDDEDIQQDVAAAASDAPPLLLLSSSTSPSLPEDHKKKAARKSNVSSSSSSSAAAVGASRDDEVPLIVKK